MDEPACTAGEGGMAVSTEGSAGGGDVGEPACTAGEEEMVLAAEGSAGGSDVDELACTVEEGEISRLGCWGWNQEDSNPFSSALSSFQGIRVRQSFISVIRSSSSVARRKREVKISFSTRRRMGGRSFPNAIPVFSKT